MEIDSKEFFETANVAYRIARADYSKAKRAIFAARVTVTAIKECMAECEADLVANGGGYGITIDGKNAEQRGAQLTLALAASDPYQQAAKELRKAEARAARFEADLDDAGNSLSLHRREMDAFTAWVTREAAVLNQRVPAGVH
jgi:hypothetical protein